MRWSPHVTVATILEQDNKFLFVEELIGGQKVINQPAGHWEQGETLLEASIRETLEETAWLYNPEYLTGIYQWKHPQNHDTFLRFCFTGNLVKHDKMQILDKEILQAVWLDQDDLNKRRAELRSPLVQACLDDYCSGKRYDLSILQNI